MSSDLTALAIVIGILGVTGLMLRMMWRQMRRVNSHVAATKREAAEGEPPSDRARPAFEDYDPATGQFVARTSDVDKQLIDLGERSRNKGWYMDP